MKGVRRYKSESSIFLRFLFFLEKGAVNVITVTPALEKGETGCKKSTFDFLFANANIFRKNNDSNHSKNSEALNFTHVNYLTSIYVFMNICDKEINFSGNCVTI